MTVENPYTSPTIDAPREMLSEGHVARWGVVRCILLTAIVAVVSSIPLAGFVGLVFRFPVPFAGYASGPQAFLPAMVGAIFYSFLGGVFVQASVGCVGGLIAYLVARRDPQKTSLLVLICGTVSALPGLFLLAILDWIIGPW